MRILVLTTAQSWTPSMRLLVTLAGGLAARGDIVTIACLSGGAVERATEQVCPRLSVRAVTGDGGFSRLKSVRGIVTAMRPDAVLVQSEQDALLAAMSMGRRGGVVRRWCVGESAPERLPASRTWRTSLAGACAKLTSWGQESFAVSWPQTAHSSPAYEEDTSDGDDRAAHGHSLWIVPPVEHDERTAIALRAASRLVGRHPGLRIMLLGELASLQSTRVHAASLGLTQFVHHLPIDALLRDEQVRASAVWVTAGGDDGAIATLAAMQRGLPTVVPQELPFSIMVAPRVTGFTIAEPDVTMVVAELARLMSDQHEREAMAAAAQARAARLFGWDKFVDDAAECLAGSAGVRAARITTRPSLTPVL